MQASRASSRAIWQIAASSKQTRNLHMTGPATFSNLLNSERPASNPPSDVSSLRAECKKHKLPTTGSRADLINRLSAHELAGARAFSTSIQDSKRPSTEAGSAATSVRHFNTSRSLKKVKDSSTIDFAYYPDFDPDTEEAPVLRVPILPSTIMSQSHAAEAEEPVMIPTIFTAAADGTHIYAPSAMSDVTDNNSIDFQGMATTIADRLGSQGQETGSMVRQVWNGLVEDILGPNHKRN